MGRNRGRRKARGQRHTCLRQAEGQGGSVEGSGAGGEVGWGGGVGCGGGEVVGGKGVGRKFSCMSQPVKPGSGRGGVWGVG